MATGVDGVANLAWKLAATVQGWGGPALLSSFEIERKPIGWRNVNASRELGKRIATIQAPAALEQNTPQGEAERYALGLHLSTFLEEFLSLGIHLGARYDGSPIVLEDGTPPADSLTEYVPSGVPGGRAPHFWFEPAGMPKRRSLFDQFGTGFTLLRLGESPPHAESLVAAATRRGIPFAVVDVPDPEARELYGRDLALVRPDQHLCWRGNRLPDECDALLARVTGH
jgi:hypothetical protein